MKRITTLTILLLTLTTALSAQGESNKRWEYKMTAGHNIGGTSPIPLPAEIRKIEAWRPLALGGTLAFHVTRRLTPTWGVTSGIAIDIKGVTVKARVKYMNTSLVIGEGSDTGLFGGMFTGLNETRVRNGYLSLPLLATFSPSERLRLHLGGYAAFLKDARLDGGASDGYIRNGGPAGERINIEESTFDFSDQIRKVDAGLMALTDWYFTNRLAITGQLSWGLTPIFPSTFNGIPYKMYNIYLMAGLSFRL
ncbi:MAG: PorT family protein [Tannerellaceae bacterium]|jgi:hypothetical protein|nr:PorT family protein [Tannerellaceae bacterium]